MKLAIKGARVLTPTGGWADEDLVIRDDVIESIGGSADTAFDAGGTYVLPGIIDLHGDAFEKALAPRPGSLFPPQVALDSVDRQLAAHGITTGYCSPTYTYEAASATRREDYIHDFVRFFREARANLRCDMRLHLRFEIYHLAGLDAVEGWMERGLLDLLAFNDHLSYYSQLVADEGKRVAMAAQRGTTPEALLESLERTRDARPRALEGVRRLAAVAGDAGIVTASHDEEDVESRRWYHDLGCRICEFPCNRETAATAIELGDDVVLGAPNALKGGSLYSRMSARDAVGDGLCTILASDYYYPAQLHAAFLLEDLGICSLAEAWELNSAAPARALGLDDRGQLEPGKRADLVIVDRAEGGVPDVVATMVGGRFTYLSDATRVLSPVPANARLTR